MDYTISRTEKKRRAKDVEKLSKELVELPPGQIASLPCDDFLKEEIRLTKTLKAGSRKRQIKYIAKELRQLPLDDLFDFLEKSKGSRLRKNIEHQDLERLRNDIIGAAIDEYNDLDDHEGYFSMDRNAPPLRQAAEMFPELDIEAIASAADNFAATRKVSQSREMFRALKAAAEKSKY